MTLRHATWECLLGTVTLVAADDAHADGDAVPVKTAPASNRKHASDHAPLTGVSPAGGALAGVYLDGQAHFPSGLGEQVPLESDPLLLEAATQLREYLAGERRGFDLPLAAPRGAFEASIREALLAVPYGHTTTYGQIAGDLGDPHLAQAVGQAVGHNPFAIVVPCHRVLGSDGTLTGYAGGVDRKAYLLDLEQHTIGATILPPTAPPQWEAQRQAATEHRAP